MSCEHGQVEGQCELCDAKDAAWSNGYAAGKAERSAEILNYDAANASLFAENKKLRELVRLIFESTPPYHDDGSPVINDKAAAMWVELTANA